MVVIIFYKFWSSDGYIYVMDSLKEDALDRNNMVFWISILYESDGFYIPEFLILHEATLYIVEAASL